MLRTISSLSSDVAPANLSKPQNTLSCHLSDCCSLYRNSTHCCRIYILKKLLYSVCVENDSDLLRGMFHKLTDETRFFSHSLECLSASAHAGPLVICLVWISLKLRLVGAQSEWEGDECVINYVQRLNGIAQAAAGGRKVSIPCDGENQEAAPSCCSPVLIQISAPE